MHPSSLPPLIGFWAHTPNTPQPAVGGEGCGKGGWRFGGGLRLLLHGPSSDCQRGELHRISPQPHVLHSASSQLSTASREERTDKFCASYTLTARAGSMQQKPQSPSLFPLPPPPTHTCVHLWLRANWTQDAGQRMQEKRFCTSLTLTGRVGSGQ